MKLSVIILLLITLIPRVVVAEAEMERMSKIDTRTVSFNFNEDDVYPVTLYAGYTTQFVF